jgi:hypothetical protein
MRIAFLGDYCNSSNNQCSEYYNDIENCLKDSDFVFIDLEGPILDKEYESYKISKSGPHLHSNLQSVELLKRLGTTHLCCANNHFMDYGFKGYESTLTACKDKNIELIGVGTHGELAIKSIIYNGIKIGLLNFCENEFSTFDYDGISCHGLDTMDITRCVLNNRDNFDFLVCVAHGGVEHYPNPSPGRVKLLRYLIDIGVNAVISHHSHIIGPSEYYNDGFIHYGLGNFEIETTYKVPNFQEWKKGVLLKLDFKLGSPVKAEEYLIKHSDIDKMTVNKLNHFESKVDLKMLELDFLKYLKQNKRSYSFYFEPYRNDYYRFLYNRELLPSFLNKSTRMKLLNIIRSESNREVILKLLECAEL